MFDNDHLIEMYILHLFNILLGFVEFKENPLILRKLEFILFFRIRNMFILSFQSLKDNLINFEINRVVQNQNLLVIMSVSFYVEMMCPESEYL